VQLLIQKPLGMVWQKLSATGKPNTGTGLVEGPDGVVAGQQQWQTVEATQAMSWRNKQLL
jgi:hypothetical protein